MGKSPRLKIKSESPVELGIVLPTIDFSRIRAHSGSQHIGFEELCVQLFSRSLRTSGDCRRVEGAGGDQGVEAYILRADNTEVGLQCKWFKTLKNGQWRQIDKSVQTALAKHPRLTEYRLALPIDRTPNQFKIWFQWEKKWAKLTKHRVSFVWLGKFELSDFLAQSAYRDLLIYWFGAPYFSDKWMDGIIHSSLKNLDRRYSPKQHVETESGRLANIFAWAPSFTEEMKRSVLDLADAWQKYFNSWPKEPTGDVVALRPPLTMAMKQLLASEIPSIATRSVATAMADVDAAFIQWKHIHELIDEIERKVKPVNPNGVGLATTDYKYFLMASDKLGHCLRQWQALLDRSSLADKHRLIVLGEAGTGKSHLMASLVDHARKRGQPALLLLGEHFTASDEPWSQALKVMGWEASLEWLLSAFNQAGYLANLPALICIDAINESDDRSLWVSHLDAFAAKISDYPFVRLIFSCRSDFAEITLPPHVADGRDTTWTRIRHYGFGEEVFEAVANYFQGYGIKSTHFPPLIEEFRNPLFLRLFCEAFENQQLPEGPLTLERVMSARIQTLTAKLQQDIDCSADDVKAAIYAVAHLIRQNNGRAVDKEAAKTAINEFSPDKKHSRSLYTHLRSSGILIEVTEHPKDAKPVVTIRFAFERFSDYFIAVELLTEIHTPLELKFAWKNKGRFGWLLDRDAYWRNRGLLSALAILLPERYQVELSTFIKNPDLQRYVLEDFLASLPWRSAASFTQKSLAVLRQSQRLGFPQFLQAILRIATIPGHPYNADFLHNRLLKMVLPTRELVWTIPVADLSSDQDSVPSMIVTWSMRVPPKLVSDDQALLVSRVLCWFLSSNQRSFRKRATVAAIRILEGRGSIAAQLIRDFDQVNDPYIIERVYAIACGVAMRETIGSGLRELSSVVHESVFAAKSVRPNVLLRDYAQTIMEVALQRRSLPDGIATESFRPPFKSKWPKILSENELSGMVNSDDWRTIVFSVRPECMGMYGDFGRYTMESRIHHFSNIPKNQRFSMVGKHRDFDGKIARRWVLQRVKELGWTPERFAGYEKNLLWLSRHDIEDIKTERISKKYQWIALHELLGYLSDHYHMRPGWNDEPPAQFTGAWQLYARDFDPSLPLEELEEDDITSIDKHSSKVSSDFSNCLLPNPFADATVCVNRRKWVTMKPPDFKPLVYYPHFVPELADEWVALNGFWDWQEPEYQAHRLAVSGRLKMWMHLRSWFVHEDELPAFLRSAKKVHFWGHGCQGVSLEGWIGEYPWGKAYDETKAYCSEPDSWIEKIKIQHTRTTCIWDVREGFTVPSPQLCEILSLRWSGNDARFVNQDGELVAFQTGKISNSRGGPCVVRLDALRSALRREHLSIVWAFLGERNCWDGSKHVGGTIAQFSGLYSLSRSGIRGGLTQHILEFLINDD